MIEIILNKVKRKIRWNNLWQSYFPYQNLLLADYVYMKDITFD